MRFRKIKFNGEEVTLAWETLNGEDRIEHKLASKDLPAPEFVEAMRALLSEALDVCDLPEEYGEGMRVTGVSLNYEEASERMGCVVTCLKDLSSSNAPLVLNTPHLREPDAGDTNLGQMSSGMETKINALTQEAERYINGHRQQGDLFAAVEEAAEDFVRGAKKDGLSVTLKAPGREPVTIGAR